jgi:cytochrome P450/NADPH-cytochrome P450 reductase
MQSEKIYVQYHIRKAKDRVWAMIEDGAIIYVCGDASRMEPDVRKTLIGVVKDKLGVDDSAAGKRFDQLVAENRYLVDVWATG